MVWPMKVSMFLEVSTIELSTRNRPSWASIACPFYRQAIHLAIGVKEVSFPGKK